VQHECQLATLAGHVVSLHRAPANRDQPWQRFGVTVAGDCRVSQRPKPATPRSATEKRIKQLTRHAGAEAQMHQNSLAEHNGLLAAGMYGPLDTATAAALLNSSLGARREAVAAYAQLRKRK